MFAKWLLAAVLILSFFAVSGSRNFSTANLFTRQTTLLAGKSGHLVKSITYCRAVRQVYGRQAANCFLVLPALYLIKLHSRQTGILLRNNSGPNLPLQQKAFFYRSKTIPSNNAGEPIAFLG
ncbi:MAG: hypothetical protein ACHQIM_19645 [Sphingobacteriales bacterium]